MENKQALVEAFKELVRVMLIAAVPLLIIELESGELDPRAILLAAAIAGLKALDKWLHKSGVKTPLDLKPLDALN